MFDKLIAQIFESSKKDFKKATDEVRNFIDKLNVLLCVSGQMEDTMFFAPTSSFSVNNSIYRSNLLLQQLISRHLSTGGQAVTRRTIDMLLDNCKEMLGLARDLNTNTSGVPRGTDCDEKSFSKLQRNSAALKSYDKLDSLSVEERVAREKNFDFIKGTYIILNSVITGEIFRKLCLAEKLPESLDSSQLISADVIQVYCSPFFARVTEQTGICGLTCDFESSFESILSQVNLPLNSRSTICAEPGTSNYRMAKLLYKHLCSMQRRLERA